MTDDNTVSREGTAGATRGVGLLTGVVGLLLVAGIAAAMYLTGGPKLRSALLPRTAEGRLLEERVLDQTDTELSTHDLLDDFLVVDFVFTNCTATCPPLSHAMLELQGRVEGVDDVHLVSFTVDPKRDSPAVLAAYAHKIGADPKRWSFLFTNQGTVHRIAYEGMKMGHPTEVMAHSNDFALVDRHGQVRGYYHPLKDADWLDVLLGDIDRLRDEPDSGNRLRSQPESGN